MYRILVPFDGSPSSARALDQAVTVAKAEAGADLQLLNVQEPLTFREALFRDAIADLRALQAERNEAGRQALQPAEQALGDAGLPWQAHVATGEPAASIAEHVARYRCDAVVMGTRGMRSTANMLLGSVTTKVLHLVNVPVTLASDRVARTGNGSAPRVLVPTDGSAHAERAVRHVMDYIGRRGPFAVHLLNVQPRIQSGMVRRIVSRATIDAYYRAEGDAAMQSAIALLKAVDIAPSTHIEVGEFGETIASFAECNGCTEIVMGTRGMGAIGNWLLGSVATKVIHYATVPVTLIR